MCPALRGSRTGACIICHSLTCAVVVHLDVHCSRPSEAGGVGPPLMAFCRVTAPAGSAGEPQLGLHLCGHVAFSSRGPDRGFYDLGHPKSTKEVGRRKKKRDEDKKPCSGMLKKYEVGWGHPRTWYASSNYRLKRYIIQYKPKETPVVLAHGS